MAEGFHLLHFPLYESYVRIHTHMYLNTYVYINQLIDLSPKEREGGRGVAGGAIIGILAEMI